MKMLTLLIMFLASIDAYAQIDTLNQSVFSSSGKVMRSTDYMVEFTLGEMVIETFFSDHFILSQGFFQPESETVTNLSSISDYDQKIKIYPNPASKQLYVQLQFEEVGKVKISVYDLTGKKLMTKEFPSNQELITLSMNHFQKGQYFIKVSDLNKKIEHTFKIVRQ